MSASSTDKLFHGSIPALYETHLVPLIFAPFAEDLAQRVASTFEPFNTTTPLPVCGHPLHSFGRRGEGRERSGPAPVRDSRLVAGRGISPRRVLEIAAGTGVVTRRLAAVLPDTVAIVATDLNPPMLDHAASLGTSRPVEWRQADAMQLPFADGSFDAVVCQFGAMFFPEKSKAYAEARRVLQPGGSFLFNVWDRIEENEFADVVTTALAGLFPAAPPRFLARTPHGYHDLAQLAQDLARGGFTRPAQISTVTARSRADSARIPAIAYCQGTPLRNEIETRDASRLAEATERVTEHIAQRFGRGPVDGKIQAHIVCVTAD